MKRASLHPDMKLLRYYREQKYRDASEAEIRIASARKSQRANWRRMRFVWNRMSRIDIASENRYRRSLGWEPL